MIFAAIVDGKFSVVHAFINENGRHESVNGDCYLKLLQETIWPIFRLFASKKKSVEDARQCSCPLHNYYQGIPLEKVSRQSDQPWDRCCVASSFTGFESTEFSLLGLSSKTISCCEAFYSRLTNQSCQTIPSCM